MQRTLVISIVCAAAVATPGVPALAQARPLTRADAVASAVSRGARLELAAADTGVANGLLTAARAFMNPTAGVSYTEDTPQYHFGLDIPLDYPWTRNSRIRAAQSMRRGAQHRFTFERAAAGLDADTLYTLALAGRTRLDLSRRNALDADSLRRIVVARRDAGDASTLDVELATLFSGEQANAASADSLEYLGTLLTLQSVMGLATDSVRIAPSDSLGAPPSDATRAPSATPLAIAAARADLDAADELARVERHNRWAAPGISIGYDTRDPGGHENKLLPAIGLSLPIPLFNRNAGPVAIADAELARSRAVLALATRESAAEIARAIRQRDIAVARATRGQQLLGSATRVAALSLTAYREGAATLASVLEAQRTSRDLLGAYVDDLARAWISIATVRVLTLTATPDRQ